jgi:hypothetical protein
MIKLSIRLAIPGLSHEQREKFVINNLQPDDPTQPALARITVDGVLTYRVGETGPLIPNHPEWANYTGTVWAMSADQQYMFGVVDGQLTTVMVLNGSLEVRKYVQHVRHCQSLSLSLSRYVGVYGDLFHKTALPDRKKRLIGTPWLQTKYLRQKWGMSRAQAKAFVRAEHSPDGVNVPVPISDIVQYAK